MTRDNEETTQCGLSTVSCRDVFTSSSWGATLTCNRNTLYPNYLGFYFPIIVLGLFDVHILKDPPGLFSNPEVKLERVYWVITWETSGETCMMSNSISSFYMEDSIKSILLFFIWEVFFCFCVSKSFSSSRVYLEWLNVASRLIIDSDDVGWKLDDLFKLVEIGWLGWTQSWLKVTWNWLSLKCSK